MEMKRFQFMSGRILALGMAAGLISMAASAADAPADRMEASTVRVLAKLSQGVGTGSGFVVGDGSFVVTNHHVIDGAQKIVVAAKDLDVEATVVVDDAERDLAVLKIGPQSTHPAVQFSLRANVHKLQSILVAGFPAAADDDFDGNKDEFLEVKFTQGIISAFVRANSGTNLYQISAPLNPGNSGGPLFDECGRVVGINELKSLRETTVVGPDGQPTKERLPYGEGVAWSIQADDLMPILQRAGITPVIANACGSGDAGAAGNGANNGPGNNGPGNNNAPQPRPAPGRLLLWGFGSLVVLGLVVGFVVRMTSRPSAAPAGGKGLQGGQMQRDGMPAAVDFRLRGLSGPYAGKEFPLSAEPITLGRDPHMSQIVFDAQDSVVSKRHCTVRIDRAAGGMVVEDCGSTNGTYLENGERLRAGEPRLVRPYGSFYLGDRRHSFQVKG